MWWLGVNDVKIVDWKLQCLIWKDLYMIFHDIHYIKTFWLRSGLDHSWQVVINNPAFSDSSLPCDCAQQFSQTGQLLGWPTLRILDQANQGLVIHKVPRQHLRVVGGRCCRGSFNKQVENIYIYENIAKQNWKDWQLYLDMFLSETRCNHMWKHFHNQLPERISAKFPVLNPHSSPALNWMRLLVRFSNQISFRDVMEISTWDSLAKLAQASILGPPEVGFDDYIFRWFTCIKHFLTFFLMILVG